MKAPQKAERIELEKAALFLSVGRIFSLEATVLTANAYNQSVEWTTTDSNVATVEGGNVTAVGEGECDIVCSATDGSGVSATCHVTVGPTPHYWLTVKVPNGSYAVDITGQESVVLRIPPDEGYKLHSVTINGEESLSVMTGSTITILNPMEDQVVNAVFVEDNGLSTNIDNIEDDTDNLRVAVHNCSVNISRKDDATTVYVYSLNGTLVKSTTETSFELATNAVYIIQIGSKSFKVAL